MTARITVCGLGPGGPGRLTEASAAALDGPDPVVLRTGRHPNADRAGTATTFDQLYDQADSFDEVYRRIVEELLEAADRHGRVVYAVPGSPLVLERSVRALLDRGAEAQAGDGGDGGVEIEVLPGLSFLDEAWARLGVDPVDDGVRLVDGHRFATEAADQRGPLLVAHAHAQWVLSDIKLAVDAGPEQRVIVLQGLGTDQESIVEVGWPDLDRAVEADHLTSLYLPELAAPVGSELARSIEMMDRLRRDCPWDQAQDHGSLRRFLLEEAYEVVEAIDRLVELEPGREANDEQVVAASIELEEELGDLWFQILFHSRLAAESGWFTLADVARTLTDKMIERHPHVYADVDPATGVSVAEWERLKQQQKSRQSVMDDVPAALPALARADKVLKRAEGAGVVADHGGLDDAMRAALDGSSAEPDDLIGSALLALVDEARRQGVNAEEALRRAVARAVDRYRAGESAGVVDGRWVRG